jgi:tRNA threonylcarbamoyladenosine biosynthesis protein TsaE
MNLNDFEIISNIISDNIKESMVILLNGDLGTGKTTLTQKILNKIVEDDQIVSSPTFSIIKTYNGKNGFKFYHSDLYRIRDPQEIEYLDMFYDKKGVYLIEWAEFLDYLIPDENITINLFYNENIEFRDVEIYFNGEKYKLIEKKLIEWSVDRI